MYLAGDAYKYRQQKGGRKSRIRLKTALPALTGALRPTAVTAAAAWFLYI